MHPLVDWARTVVRRHVTGADTGEPEQRCPEMSGRAGVFVSLKVAGRLRGCIGTIEATRDTVLEEIRRNAVAAAVADPRFPPVSADELDALDYSVDVLSPPEPVTDRSELDPRRFGVIVTKGAGRGLLLPDLEGIDTADEQIRIAALKGRIDPADPDLKIERFEVRRYR